MAKNLLSFILIQVTATSCNQLARRVYSKLTGW